MSKKKKKVSTDTVDPVKKLKPARVSLSAMMEAQARPTVKINPYQLPKYAPGVLPDGVKLAMDDNLWASENSGTASTYQWVGSFHGTFAEGIGFMGYPYLAELTQRSEYRRPSEIIAEEMTRKWIRITAVGDDDKTDKVKELEQGVKNFDLRKVLYDALLLDGYFGMSQIYIDTGETDKPENLRVPLVRRKGIFKKGGLQGFRVVDPSWIAPNNYNSLDPLKPDYYRPQSWFVMGKEVNSSRLMTICSRPVPDLLKPAYNFGGVSLSQIMKPYVDNWLKTRQAVSDLLVSFTVFILETNMGAVLQGESGADLFNRIDLFNNMRSNRGMMVTDKNTEGFSNVSAPLGTLDALQSQAQEHQASVSAIPLTKAFGITPSGLNTSTDGEIRTFYDSMHARQENVASPIINDGLDLIQLHLFGEIDPDIRWEWVPLWQLDEAGKASVRKTDADTDAVLIGQGVISPEESRIRVAADVNSPYSGLDPADLPDPPQQPGADPSTQDPSESIDKEAESGSTTGANNGDTAFAQDDFNESDHPRGQPENAGQFAKSSSGGKVTRIAGHEHAEKDAAGKHIGAGGKAFPAHIAAFKIPPAWTDVTYATDPNAPLQVTGKDAKGRVQAVYSAKHVAAAAAAKFKRVQAMDKAFDGIVGQNEKNRKSNDPRIKDAADATSLVMATGIRPGSDTDTGAKVKAYGATTLEGRHVIKTANGVELHFVGKKGVELKIPVTDQSVANMLLQRKAQAGNTGKLFKSDETKLREYVHTLGTGEFKTKDFRTLLGTRTALNEVAKVPAPKNAKEYKAAVLQVAKAVSAKLGNTPTVALQSYINPVVFAPWGNHNG